MISKTITYVLFFSVTFCSYSSQAKTFLVFGGKTGWIGRQLMTLIEQQGHISIAAHSRLENRESICSELKSVRPDFVINAAGITGRPNVDWCEINQQETLRVNVLGALNLADITYLYAIPYIMISTGCIYEYDDEHPMCSGKGFDEEDEPNFNGSFYSRTKIIVEKLLRAYPHLLLLRLRMPIADDLTQRAFIGKIVQYKKLVNIPNSMAVTHDLLPLVIDMALKGCTGVFNFVNPGTLSHYEIMDLYKKYIDPEHVYEKITIEEQDMMLKARRSNCELSAKKLLSLYPQIPHIKDAIIGVFERMCAVLNKGR